MNNVIFQGQEISSWIEYIQLKFHDDKYFEIGKEEGRNYIVINSRTNKSKIWFYGLETDKLRLEDCQYSSEDCKGWSGETCAVDPDKHGTFSQENLNTVDEILEIPIHIGWFSIDYYLGKSFYKSIAYQDKTKTKPGIIYHGEKFGCISIILFPVFILINFLVNRNIIGNRKEILIDPIIKKKK